MGYFSTVTDDVVCLRVRPGITNASNHLTITAEGNALDAATLLTS